MQHMIQFEALFAEHAAPTYAAKDSIRAEIGVLLALGANVQKQMIEYKSLLVEAQMSDTDPVLESKYEHIHQTFAGIEREVNAFVNAGRLLASALNQLDTYIETTKADVVAYNEARSAQSLAGTV